MIRTAYKVAAANGDDSFPLIEKVDITDVDGVSWREAKKQLRSWFLQRAKDLRKTTEKEYFGS